MPPEIDDMGSTPSGDDARKQNPATDPDLKPREAAIERFRERFGEEPTPEHFEGETVTIGRIDAAIEAADKAEAEAEAARVKSDKRERHGKARQKARKKAPKDVTLSDATRGPSGKGLDTSGWGKALRGEPTQSTSGDAEASEAVRHANAQESAREAALTGRRAKGDALAPDRAAIAEETATTRWWVGTLSNCPRSVVHLGGITFQEYVDPEVEGMAAGAPSKRAHKFGQLVDLTERQIEDIVDHLQRKFWRGSDLVALHPRADVETLKERRRYRPVEMHGSDVPVASTVYMVPLDHRREELPASVYETGITW